MGAYEIARVYARTQDRRNTLAWLQKSLEYGYVDRVDLAADVAFKQMWNDPQFRTLAGELPRHYFNRVDGWRYDLTYLVSEIKRVHYIYHNRAFAPRLLTEVAFINKEIPRMTDEDTRVHFERLMSMLNDGHSLLFPVKLSTSDAERGSSKKLPIRFYSFSDGLFVIFVTRPMI